MSAYSFVSGCSQGACIVLVTRSALQVFVTSFSCFLLTYFHNEQLFLSCSVKGEKVLMSCLSWVAVTL